MAKNTKRQSAKPAVPSLAIELDREVDGRWIAEIPKLPGVLVYGATKREALRNLSAVALRTLADGVENGAMLASVSRLFRYGVAQR
jgi:predicted RNase H-like HicB family nuclease